MGKEVAGGGAGLLNPQETLSEELGSWVLAAVDGGPQ